MDIKKIRMDLASLMYYSAKPKRKKGEVNEPLIAFGDLPEEKKEVFESLAETVLIHLDQMNLRLIPKAKEIKNPEEVEALLKNKIEGAVKDFFAQVKIWKKDLIPQQELVAKIYQVWAAL